MLRQNDNLQFRSPNDLHEIHLEKLNFFISSLNLLDQSHTTQYCALLKNNKFKHTLTALLKAGESTTRLKAH